MAILDRIRSFFRPDKQDDSPRMGDLPLTDASLRQMREQFTTNFEDIRRQVGELSQAQRATREDGVRRDREFQELKLQVQRLSEQFDRASHATLAAGASFRSEVNEMSAAKRPARALQVFDSPETVANESVMARIAMTGEDRAMGSRSRLRM